MKKGILLGLVLGLMVLGTAVESVAQHRPVLEKIWIIPEVNYGSLLKLYIKASDSEGDMKWVVVTAGRGAQPVASVPVRLGKQMRKDLNGYVYWDTRKALLTEETSATIEVLIEDRHGNESETKSVTVKLVPRGAKEEKPPADFKEIAIGPVMLETDLQRTY